MMANENAERAILAGRGISAPSTNPNSRGILYKVELRKIPYLPALDGVRAVAVLLVVWSHFPYVSDSTISIAIWKIGQALRVGYFGVDLFFVLSGFLITRILLNELERTG